MIIPSIDLEGGRCVQLVGGEELAIDAGDPRPLATRFGRVGEIAVIDLDAAKGEGDNRALVEELLPLARCRVGGGIRDVETARRWLDAGAERIIVGTAASPQLLRELPADRVIVALDARDDEVVVEGWRKGTGTTVLQRMEGLRGLCAGFLVTWVEREGRMGGIELDAARALREAAGDARLTVAGGVTTAQELAALDAMGVDAQVGMALYTGRLPLDEAFLAPLRERLGEGPWPTVVADEYGRALGLVYSDAGSVGVALERGVGAYHSRRRGLWIKGESSGNTQELIAIDLDCDRDALRFTVRQQGAGFCHEPQFGCFGEDRGLPRLVRRLAQRRDSAPEGSYTARLFREPELLAAKLREEADELASAKERQEVVHEAADVLYFTLARLAAEGIDLAEVEAALDRRERKVARRPGDAKPHFQAGGS